MKERTVEVDVMIVSPAGERRQAMTIPSPFAAGVHPLTGMAPVSAPGAGMLPAYTGATTWGGMMPMTMPGMAPWAMMMPGSARR